VNGDNSLSRRTALCGVMAALVVPTGLVAACSASGSGSTPAPAAPSDPAGAGGGALVALAAVPEGGGVVVDGPGGKKIIVARVSATEVKAYDATCTHKGATVGVPSGGTMTCPAHGSQFAASDGAVTRGPAATGLRAVGVKVEGDQVVLA
jgi:cytochrome b6-f complex iron-sulfur subunit